MKRIGYLKPDTAPRGGSVIFLCVMMLAAAEVFGAKEPVDARTDVLLELIGDRHSTPKDTVKIVPGELIVRKSCGVHLHAAHQRDVSQLYVPACRRSAATE